MATLAKVAEHASGAAAGVPHRSHDEEPDDDEDEQDGAEADE